MVTLSVDPGAHPRRHAALAAHALREALAEVGMLEHFPECAGEVSGGRAVVQLGAIDAAAALLLADRLRPKKSGRRGRSSDVPVGTSEVKPS